MENREILKRPVIDPALIDNRQFTASLLNEMIRIGLADQTFLEFFQTQLLSILHDQLNEITNGESSSVPAELVDELMDGIGYCIDQALKAKPTLEESAQLLMQLSAVELYNVGKEYLDKFGKSCTALLSRVQSTRLKTINRAYQLVLDSTYPTFLHDWKATTFPHDFEVITEYPLAVQPSESGILGIYAQLSALALENRFCARYSAEAIDSLLVGYAHAHRVNPADAYVNLFTITLQNLLLNKLMGRDCLELTEDDRIQLEAMLSSLEPQQRTQLVIQTTELFLKDADFAYPKLETYIRSAAVSFTKLINAANGYLSELCVVTPATQTLIHTDGERLDNDAFALVAEEVMLAETAQEKIRILRSELRSLADLTDLLASGSIFEDEFEQLYALMNPITLALLLSVSPVTISGQTFSIQSDIEWQTALINYLNRLESAPIKNILALYYSAVG